MEFEETIRQLEIATNEYFSIPPSAVGAPILGGQPRKATLKAILQKANHPKESVELTAKNFGHALKGVAMQSNALRAALEAQGISVGRGNSPENRTLSGLFDKSIDLVSHAQFDSLPEWYSSAQAAAQGGAMAIDEAVVSPGGALAPAAPAASSSSSLSSSSSAAAAASATDATTALDSQGGDGAMVIIIAEVGENDPPPPPPPPGGKL